MIQFLILYVYYAITMPSGFPCWFLCQLLEARLSFDEEGHQDTNKEHRFEGVIDAVKPAEFLPTEVTTWRETTTYPRGQTLQISRDSSESCLSTYLALVQMQAASILVSIFNMNWNN